MIHLHRLILIIFAVIVSSSCVPIPIGYGGFILVPINQFPAQSIASRQELISETELKSNELGSVQTIALFEIPDPLDYGDDTEEFEGFSFGNTAQVFLKQFLEESGYEVVGVFDGKSVDAYLEVAPVNVEYRQNSLDHEFGPNVSVIVRLVSADTNKVIYSGSVQYGWDIDSSVSGIEIESPLEHKYESREALRTRKKEAIERLVYGIEAVSLNIVKKISKDEFVSVMGTPVESNLSENDNEAPIEPALESEPPASEFDISGTYVSEITSNSKWQFTRKYQNLRIKLRQKGNNIIGLDERYDTKIEATIAGGVVKFNVLAGQASGHYDASGEWKISSDGSRLVGTWISPNSADAAAGDWILRKVQ